MAPATFIYFFDLPPELRERVLHYACYEPEGIHLGGDVQLGWKPKYPSRHPSASGSGAGSAAAAAAAGDEKDAAAAPPWYLPGPAPDVYPLTLFLVSSQFYREASAAFFGPANVFHLDAASAPRPGDSLLSPEAGLLACERYAPARRRIRRAALVLRRLGGKFRDRVAPPLADMVLAGGLRRLDVRLVAAWPWAEQRGAPPPPPPPPAPASSAADAAAERALVAGEPFQALLRLLADPYLERRSLAVEAAAHWALWCPFHAAPPAGEARERLPRLPLGRPAPGVAPIVRVLGPRGGGGGRGPFLDVDVGAVLERYGGPREELHILRIGG